MSPRIFGADPVHDLRVALRRCRSLADGLMALDPDPDWKAMKKAGRRLFQRLGALRDVQVMMEWVEKLDQAEAKVAASVEVGDPAVPPRAGSPAWRQSQLTPDSIPDTADQAAQTLLEILRRREQEQQHEAQSALEEFDGKQWRQWSKSLPARAARIRQGSALFKHLAVERWTAARELHNRALRNRSQVAFHSLRIGIKRFRYIVEKLSSCRAQSLEQRTSRRSRTYSARSTISMCSGPLPFPARFFPMQIRAAVGGIESSPSVASASRATEKK